MKIFGSQPNDELTKLLKTSQQDFGFNQELVKMRVTSQLQSENQDMKQPLQHHHWMRSSIVTAVVILSLSITAVSAAQSQPGDKLFSLNKWGEKFVLSLPLSIEHKAQVQTSIVTKRLQALKKVQTQPDDLNRKLKTVNESDESLRNAVEMVTANKAKFRAMGQMAQANRLTPALNQLNDLAQEHEDQIQAIQASMPEGHVRQTMNLRLTEVRGFHQQARIELEFKDNDSPDN
jgi:hypothetical protein